MQDFTIRDIENLTGIKAHTLRIWEQRYPMLVPKHAKSKHRIYSNEQLKKLLRISFLYHSGYKISAIAALGEAEIVQLVQNTIIEPANYKLFIVQLMEASIDFDELRFTSVLNNLVENIGFEKCISDVCYPFLLKIGFLWVTNNIIPAQEHFASNIILSKIIAKTDELPNGSENNPTIVLFSPEGEHHELPLLFIHYLLKKNGWNTIYLGSNITFETLQQFKVNPSIQYFYLHIITNFTGFLLDDYLETVCRTFSTVTVVVSGAAILSLQRQFTNLIRLQSDEAIYKFIHKSAT